MLDCGPHAIAHASTQMLMYLNAHAHAHSHHNIRANTPIHPPTHPHPDTINVHTPTCALTFVYRPLSSAHVQSHVVTSGKRLDGLWHTAVVAYGTEYYFGGGIQSAPPGQILSHIIEPCRQRTRPLHSVNCASIRGAGISAAIPLMFLLNSPWIEYLIIRSYSPFVDCTNVCLERLVILTLFSFFSS